MPGGLTSTIAAAAMGVGLSAACGFRIFVPLLVLSIASHFGYVHLAPSWQWVGGTLALITFATATVVEIAAYYVPWVDHALDAAAAPLALVAGTIVTASVVTDVPPVVKWALAIIAGGGAAGAIQVSTMALRGASTATTGGLANPIVSTVEAVCAVALSVLAVVVPIVAVMVVALTLYFIVRTAVRLTRRRRATAAAKAAGA